MDYHSKLIISLKSNGQSVASEISDLIIGWKNTFSFYWYQQYVKDDQKTLDFVLALLFELTEFPDSNVTIASFNAIGALLVSLSPFRSHELIMSFKNTLTSLEVSPNTSCAVIATFVFLSHHVSDSSISNFIDSTPILPHFGADLKIFIHHIPNLIEQMDRLNMEFHQALLRSLISSFGRNPTSPFIESIMLLIKRFPSKLLSDLMEFIVSNKLEAALLSVGGPILNNSTFSELLSFEQKMTFVKILKKKLFSSESETNFGLQTEITATELEQTVSIINGLKKQTENELKSTSHEIAKAVWEQRKKLKSAFTRILYPLAQSIDELRPTKNDSTNEMSKKIMALSFIEKVDDEEFLSICEPLIDSRDECFISVMAFLSTNMKEKCHKLVKKLFEKNDYSWVQRISILNLIDCLDQFKMESYMNDYNQKCIDFLISCSLSLQTELSSMSRKVISRFVSLNNVEFFRTSILKCDFFNFQITKNILMLLNVIVNSISPTPMRCFIGIVLELFDFTLSDIINADSDDFENFNIYPSFVTDCFEFLSHYPGLIPYRKSIERICICKMQEIYFSFTQEKLFFQSQFDNSNQQNPKKNATASQMAKMIKNNVKPILSTITTDVVADASLVKYEFLKPLKNCLQYLDSNHIKVEAFRPSFAKLLPIFPKEILPYFYDNSVIVTNCRGENLKSFLTKEEIDNVMPKILRIFLSNRDQTVIARCCEFFYQSNMITQGVLTQVKKIFVSTKMKSSFSAFEFFKLIHYDEPENAFIYLKKLLNINGDNKKVNKLIKNELALLASNVPSVFHYLSETEDFSFLKIKSNRFIAKAWFEKNDFYSWPLIDSDMCDEVKKMFSKSYSVKIKDFTLVDNQHWIFVMKNKSLFAKDQIRFYINSNKSLMKSICVFKTNSNAASRNHFDFSEKVKKEVFENVVEVAKLLPSTTLLLKKGKFVRNKMLIKSFLRFSSVFVDERLLNEMESEFPNLSSYFSDYSARMAKKTNGRVQKNRPDKMHVQVNKSYNKEEQSEGSKNQKQEDFKLYESEEKTNTESEKESKEENEILSNKESSSINKEENEILNKEESSSINKEENEILNKEELILNNNKEESQPQPHQEALTLGNSPPPLNDARTSHESPLHNQSAPPSSGPFASFPLSSFDPSFPMKSKFLRLLCTHPPKDDAVIAKYHARVIDRLSELRTPKQFFFLLRFLRTSLLFAKARTIRASTISNFSRIITRLKELATSANDEDNLGEIRDFSCVLLEFVKLTMRLLGVHEVAKALKCVSVAGKTESVDCLFVGNLVVHSGKFKWDVFGFTKSVLSANSILPLKCSNLAHVPSFLSLIVRSIKLLPNEESSVFFARHFGKLFSLHLVAESAIEFLAFYFANKSGGRSYEEFFDGAVLAQMAVQLFDTKSPLFKKACEKSLIQMIFASLKGQSRQQLLQFLPLVEKLPARGYALPFAIDLSASFFASVAENVFMIETGRNQRKASAAESEPQISQRAKAGNRLELRQNEGKSQGSQIRPAIAESRSQASKREAQLGLQQKPQRKSDPPLRRASTSAQSQKAGLESAESQAPKTKKPAPSLQPPPIVSSSAKSASPAKATASAPPIASSSPSSASQAGAADYAPSLQPPPIVSSSAKSASPAKAAASAPRVASSSAKPDFRARKLLSQVKGGGDDRRQRLLSFEQEFGVKHVRVARSVYTAHPSLANALKLGRALADAASFFDAFAMIFGSLAGFKECPFIGTFCMAEIFLTKFRGEIERKEKFNDFVRTFEKQNSAYKSRGKALQIIAKGDFEKGFAVACLETDNEAKIEEVINLFDDI